jgi:hypothetical protein
VVSAPVVEQANSRREVLASVPAQAPVSARVVEQANSRREVSVNAPARVPVRGPVGEWDNFPQVERGNVPSVRETLATVQDSFPVAATSTST